MKHVTAFRATLFSICVVAAFVTTPALAQVSISITIAPPPLIYETVPVMSPGYVWAPGYWAWHEDRHIWVRGRTIVQRSGYRWEPDRWDHRGSGYYQMPGHWQSDYSRPVLIQRTVIKPKHGKDKDEKHGKGNGNRNKNERGRQQEN